MGIARNLTDEERCSETLAELFAALEAPLLLYAMKLVHNEETAQDLVQDAFLRLHSRLPAISKPRPWLYRTVHNLAMDYHRRRRRLVPLGGEEETGGSMEQVDTEPLPDVRVERLEAIELARFYLAKLDEKEAVLIRLKFEEQLSYREMSARTGLKVSYVGYVLHHALKKLAAELAREGVVP